MAKNDTRKYIVCERQVLEHDQETYEAGETVAMKEKQAEPLLERGIIAPEKGDVPEANPTGMPEPAVITNTGTSEHVNVSTGTPETPATDNNESDPNANQNQGNGSNENTTA